MKGTHSVQTLITAVVASALLVFSAGTFAQARPFHAKSADSQSANAKPAEVKAAAHVQAAPVNSAINLNKADVQTLAQLNGVGEKKAQDIITYREANGGFKAVDELLNVKGIGEKTLEKNRALLSVN